MSKRTKLFACTVGVAIGLFIVFLSGRGVDAATKSDCNLAYDNLVWMRYDPAASAAYPLPTFVCVSTQQRAADLADTGWSPQFINSVGGYYLHPQRKVTAMNDAPYGQARAIWAHEHGHWHDWAIGKRVWPNADQAISAAMPGLDAEGYANWYAYLTMGGHPDIPAPPYVSGDQLRSWQYLGWLPYGTRNLSTNGTTIQYVDTKLPS